jgi:hypothetical protein
MLRVASHWKATIHIYNLKRFQEIQKFIAFIETCPKSLNSMYGTPRPLGVNIESTIRIMTYHHMKEGISDKSFFKFFLLDKYTTYFISISATPSMPSSKINPHEPMVNFCSKWVVNSFFL